MRNPVMLLLSAAVLCLSACGQIAVSDTQDTAPASDAAVSVPNEERTGGITEPEITSDNTEAVTEPITSEVSAEIGEIDTSEPETQAQESESGGEPETFSSETATPDTIPVDTAPPDTDAAESAEEKIRLPMDWF